MWDFLNFKVSSIRSLPLESRYDKVLLDSFKSTPWNHKNDGKLILDSSSRVPIDIKPLKNGKLMNKRKLINLSVLTRPIRVLAFNLYSQTSNLKLFDLMIKQWYHEMLINLHLQTPQVPSMWSCYRVCE